MNKKLPKPSLKGPELKLPTFVMDLYRDLRDRRLLPLIALLLVAIAVVPFALGEEAEREVPVADGGAETGAGVAAPARPNADLAVVASQPELRDYRKRLDGRPPRNPFKQQYTGVPKSAQLESTGTGSQGGSGEAPIEGSGGGTATAPVPAGPGGSRGGGPPTSLEGKRLFGYRPDVRFGKAGSNDLTLYADLPLGSLLPKGSPVALFVGVTQNGERALFNVSSEVAVRGDGGCVGGAESCTFLSMREGEAVSLLTGFGGPAYRLKIESIDFVELDLPPKQERAEGSARDLKQARADGVTPAVAPALAQNFSN